MSSATSRKLWMGLGVGLLAGILGWSIFLRTRASRPRVTAPAKLPPVVTAAAIAPGGAEELEPLDVEELWQRAEKNQARPEPGTGEAQLEHLMRSVLAANADELTLTAAETERLVAAYLTFQEIHAEVVMHYLQETGYTPDEVNVHVPAFPREGKALRDLFYKQLATDFPDGRAGQIEEQLGHFFEGAFRGFGAGEQALTVKRSPELAGAFEVTWDSRPGDGSAVSAADRAISYPGTTGAALFYREQISSGEFRFLGGVIDRRFSTQ